MIGSTTARLIAAGALIALAGCASPPATTTAIPPPTQQQKAFSSAAGRSVLYVSETQTNAVYLFDANDIAAGPFGKITAGLTRPGALAVGPDNVLYVANQLNNSKNSNSVTLYKPGATSPFRTIFSNFGVPERVVVGADDTLAIAYGGGINLNGELVVYDKGSASPTRKILIPLIKPNILLSIVGLEIDASENIYLSTSRYGHGPGFMQKFAPGSNKGVVVPGRPPSNGGGFDTAGNMYTGDFSQLCVYAPGAKQCTRTITDGLSSVTQFAVAPDGTLFVPDTFHYTNGNPTNGDVVEFAPGGSSPIATFTSPTFVNPLGAALGSIP